MKVTVIDYGLSNLRSVANALARCGAEVELTADPAAVRAARVLVLSGVGAFGDGMAGLRGHGLIEPLREKAAAGTPLLGICLGMQMLFEESEEFGLHEGLGLIPGRVVRIPDQTVDGAPQRVPQIGWQPLGPQVEQQVSVALKYEGYLDKERRQVEQFRRAEERLLPQDADYLQVEGLRIEARQKLNALRPRSIGQASRISGVSPGDIAVLLVWLERREREREA